MLPYFNIYIPLKDVTKKFILADGLRLGIWDKSPLGASYQSELCGNAYS